MDGRDSILVLLQEWSLLAKSVLGALGNSRVATREVRLTLHVRSFLKCRKVHAELSFSHATVLCLCRCFAVLQAAIHAAQALFRGRLWSEAGWTACSQPTRSTLARYHISDRRTGSLPNIRAITSERHGEQMHSKLVASPPCSVSKLMLLFLPDGIYFWWVVDNHGEAYGWHSLRTCRAPVHGADLSLRRLKTWKKLGRQKYAKTEHSSCCTMNQGYGATNPSCRKMLNGLICLWNCSTGTNCEQQKQQPYWCIFPQSNTETTIYVQQQGWFIVALLHLVHLCCFDYPHEVLSSW